MISYLLDIHLMLRSRLCSIKKDVDSLPICIACFITMLAMPSS